MGSRKFWTEERVLTGFQACLEHHRMEDAAATLSEEWGKRITRNALQKALSEAFPDIKLVDIMGKKAKVERSTSLADKAQAMLEQVESSKPQRSRHDFLEYSHEELAVKHFEPPNFRGDLRYALNEDKPTVIHVWPDAHVPLHDLGAMEACTMFAEYMVPDIVVDLGDFLDLDEVSYHPATQVVRGGSGYLENSIRPGREIIRDQTERLDKVGVKKRAMLGGNHDIRLHRFIVQKCPELYEMMPTIPDMLGLEEFGWDYITYGGAIRIGPVQFTHGRGHSKYVACRTMEREGSTVFGHTHRMQTFVANTRPGHPEMGMTCGTRGKLTHDYQFHSPSDHVHGMGVVTILPDGQQQMLTYIIHNGILTYSLPGGKTLIIDGNKKTIKEV